MQPELPSQFKTILQEKKLLSPGETVFVACSGGPDSAALFHLLSKLRKEWKLRLGLLHFNHQLRGRASREDEHFVKNLAKKFRVPFYSGCGPVKKMAREEKYSQEEAARFARYDFFEKAAQKHRIPKIAMAHTRDDQAETVLMRLLQGTGLRGLCGIREQLTQGKVVFIRPLLSFSKQEILAFLKENKIFFRKDASNRSRKFLRNRIRLELIPWLEKEFNPKVVKALARLPESVRDEAEILNGLETAAWKRAFLRQKSKKVFLSRASFLKLPASLQFRILEKGLRRLDPKSGLDFEAWQRLKPRLREPRCRYSLPKDIDFILTPLKLMLYKKY